MNNSVKAILRVRCWLLDDCLGDSMDIDADVPPPPITRARPRADNTYSPTGCSLPLEYPLREGSNDDDKGAAVCSPYDVCSGSRSRSESREGVIVNVGGGVMIMSGRY